MANLSFGAVAPPGSVDPNAFMNPLEQFNFLAPAASPSMATAASAAPATGAATATGGAAGASAVGVETPAVGQPAGGGFLQGLGGWNIDTAKLALGGLQTLGNLFMGLRAMKQAREQFNYQKGVSETNLVNSIQAYNTALTDRANNRADAMNQDQATTDAYIEANKARRV